MWVPATTFKPSVQPDDRALGVVQADPPPERRQWQPP
jgi:hypothetical protein